MSYHYNCVAVFLIDILDKLQYLLGGVVIQSTCRFITEKDIGIFYDSSSDRCSLLLSAGKLIGELVSVLVKAECFQKIVNIQRIIAEICSDFNVFLDVKVRYEVIQRSEELS